MAVPFWTVQPTPVPLRLTVAVLPMSTGASTHGPWAGVRYTVPCWIVAALAMLGAGAPGPRTAAPVMVAAFLIWTSAFEATLPPTVEALLIVTPSSPMIPLTGNRDGGASASLLVPVNRASRACTRRVSPCTLPVAVMQRERSVRSWLAASNSIGKPAQLPPGSRSS